MPVSSKSALLILGLLATLHAQPNTLMPEEQAQGFELLFDGHTTADWLEITGAAFPKSWSIDDGCLKPIAGLPGFQDIRTTAEYRNFDLRFEWRVGKGANSGVKYLIDKVDRWVTKDKTSYHARARGLEYQVVDDALNSDAQASLKNTSGALYGRIAPVGPAAHAAGDWNSARILVRGPHVEHWLNGQKVVECEGAADFGVRNTPISLQNHDSDAWFRTLRIRRLE